MAKVHVAWEPSQSERQMAAGVHAGALFAPLVGPTIGLIVGNSSPYVRYHAWNSLLGQIALMMISLSIGLVSLGHTITTLWNAYQTGTLDVDWVQMILKSVGVWLAIWIFGAINTVSEFFQIFSSWRGRDWGGKNPVAAMARRFALGKRSNLVSSSA